MLEKKIRNFLGEIQQKHLAEGLENLSEKQKAAFWQQLSKYPVDLLQKQRDAVFFSQKKLLWEEISPIFQSSFSLENRFITFGKVGIHEKKLGCVVLAGGQATRLQSEVSKALYPITLVRKKTLLQLLLEKVKAASIRAKCDLPIAIMVSAFNQEEIQCYLKENLFFGLKKEQVSYFCQDALPLVDEKGNWALEKPGMLAEGPDGNGRALQLFMKSVVGSSWKQNGVTDVNVIMIDNPLADPFDAQLCDFRYENNLDVAIKAIKRRDPDEKVGVFTSYHDKIKVIEYTELPKELRYAKNTTGELLFSFANIGLFCFSLSFLEKLYLQSSTVPIMPWHIAKKEVPIFSNGKEQKKQMHKLEYFLFDIFDFVDRTKLLIYPREDVYAPLKNAKGEDSVETLQKRLLEYDRKVFEKISGISVQDRIFELDPQFYYPSTAMQKYWLGRALPKENYIEP